MAKVGLTDRFITSRKRGPPAGRADRHDAVVPGLTLRMTSAGHRSFVLVARYATRPKNPTRRALGDHGEWSLGQAREKARAWLVLIRKGVDPKVEDARQRAAAQRQQVNTFMALWDACYGRHASSLAKAPLWRERGRIPGER